MLSTQATFRHVEITQSLERRPLYHAFAWAYDLLVTDPVEPFVEVVVNAFAGHGVEPGSRVLDAGCGTGRYALELARQGFRVDGMDSSADLVAVAEDSAAAAGLAHRPAFAVADLRHLQAPVEYDGVLCRGVLNDLRTDDERDQALHGLAAALRPGGVLVLDVRDWKATVNRYRTDPVYERTARLPDGELRFRSSGRLRPVDQQLLLAERVTVRRGRTSETYEYDFALRCWSEEELRARLKSAGFAELAVRPGVGSHAQDRLLCRAVRASR
jgi:2-polyprenyl-3-methyl-5-hydroxy-6-metoxy-1,4-benzoquinol methylase